MFWLIVILTKWLSLIGVFLLLLLLALLILILILLLLLVLVLELVLVLVLILVKVLLMIKMIKMIMMIILLVDELFENEFGFVVTPGGWDISRFSSLPFSHHHLFRLFNLCQYPWVLVLLPTLYRINHLVFIFLIIDQVIFIFFIIDKVILIILFFDGVRLLSWRDCV